MSLGHETRRVSVGPPPGGPVPPPLARRARDLLGQLLRPLGERPWSLELWDGTLVPGSGPDPGLRVILRHPAALRALLVGRDAVSLAEAYLAGLVDLEGNIDLAFDIARDLAAHPPPAGLAWRLGLLALRLPRPPRAREGVPGGAARLAGEKHSKERDAAAIRHHYDVGDDFYRVFLDRRMVYSCAWWHRDGMTLDEAQEAKLDLVCRKLGLRPGMKVLDIGCGWGSFVIFAAERYGVEAHGITLSRNQAAAARRRAAAAGVADRVRIDLLDYRDLPGDGRYDRVASIGMAEHVGRRMFPAYMETAFRALRPGGLFLHHAIASRVDVPADSMTAFIDRYVFPDGELLPPGFVLDAAERASFEVLDVHGLRPHYARTLRAWVRRLEAGRERAVAAGGERAWRLWRLYMAGCARAFASGRVGVYQVLLARRRADGSHDAPEVRVA